MFGLRVLRKRWVLGVIFGCSLIYFITSIYKQSEEHLTQSDLVPNKQIPNIIQWQNSIGNKINNSNIATCRNSVQGKTLITDDKGYVCERDSVELGGCCMTSAPTTTRFNCNTCGENACCAVYEYCVSCCLQPEKQPLLRKILGQASDTFQHLFASVTDHFELCLAKCRTSSQSVQHENSYRDPSAKFCYGENPPDLQPGLNK